MKAMILDKTDRIENNPLKFRDVNIKNPADKEILIKNISCGVCRSNLHMIEGDWNLYGVPAKLPIIPGHEVIGRVEELGDNVTALKKGDMVGVQPLFEACGKCEYCLNGRENLCPYGKYTGESVDGGFAEYMIANSEYVTRIPETIDPINSPLFCPGVTAYSAIKKAELSPGKTVYIVGIGGVGHIAIQIAKLYGAHVVAVTTSKKHEELAYKMGADDSIILDNSNNALKAMNSTADSLVIFAPDDNVMRRSLNFVKDGGIVVQGVIGNFGPILSPRELTIKGTKIGTRSEMNEVIKLASSGKIKIEYKKYPLDEANQSLQDLKKGIINGRAIITFK